ncbi:MAG: biotin--[acetyl-CoA-carboxylase] ligase [Chromatiales bacterium]|nr:biotin--[acetyl-CoA-carboxylase] ligase [Chromatiales bacterium]
MDRCSSTNDYLLYRPPPPQDKFNLCVAYTQSAGRGRHGKTWHSDHPGIYLSVSWQVTDQITNDGWLLLTTAMRLAESLQALGIRDLGIKWPNDLYYKNAKLAGMLIELHGDIAIMGIGLNITTPNQAVNDSKIHWVGLDKTTIAMPTYTQLLTLVVTAVLKVCKPIIVKENKELFSKFDVLYNQSIEIEHKGKKVSVIAKGIDHKARLLVEYNGQIKAYSYAETKVYNDQIIDRYRQ